MTKSWGGCAMELSPSIALLYRSDRAVLVQPFKTGGLDIDATLLKYSYHAHERELAFRYAQRRKDYATHEELIPLNLGTAEHEQRLELLRDPTVLILHPERVRCTMCSVEVALTEGALYDRTRWGAHAALCRGADRGGEPTGIIARQQGTRETTPVHVRAEARAQPAATRPPWSSGSSASASSSGSNSSFGIGNPGDDSFTVSSGGSPPPPTPEKPASAPSDPLGHIPPRFRRTLRLQMTGKRPIAHFLSVAPRDPSPANAAPAAPTTLTTPAVPTAPGTLATPVTPRRPPQAEMPTWTPLRVKQPSEAARNKGKGVVMGNADAPIYVCDSDEEMALKPEVDELVNDPDTDDEVVEVFPNPGNASPIKRTQTQPARKQRRETGKGKGKGTPGGKAPAPALAPARRKVNTEEAKARRLHALKTQRPEWFRERWIEENNEFFR